MLQEISTLIAFLAPLAYSPGPGNGFFAAVGARYGLRGTLPANLGYHVATFIVTVIIGLGFGAMAETGPQILAVLRYLGSAYVLYLAWILISSGASHSDVQPRAATFADGIILMVLNPKAYLIISLMFTQFLDARQPVDWWRVVWITTVFTLNNFLAFTLWAYAGDVLAARFRDPQQARWLNIGLGLMLGAVAIWMLAR
jgi:threonine/homoserine/homoserine lactone efflux protein